MSIAHKFSLQLRLWQHTKNSIHSVYPFSCEYCEDTLFTTEGLARHRGSAGDYAMLKGGVYFQKYSQGMSGGDFELHVCAPLPLFTLTLLFISLLIPELSVRL